MKSIRNWITRHSTHHHRIHHSSSFVFVYQPMSAKSKRNATHFSPCKKRRTSTSKPTKLIVLDYNDLLEGKDLSEQIKNAFGTEGLGILAVSNVPNVAEQRQALLPLAPKFSNLSDEHKALYEHPQSFWSFGWSHGKEKLQGRPDFAKGSYYNNPCSNTPFGSDPTTKTIQDWISFAHPNIWPTKHLPELEPAFMSLGQTMCSVGALVAKQCDTYVSNVSQSYEKGKLARVLTESKVTKARLLHYFPKAEEKRARADSIEVRSSAYRGRSGSFNDVQAVVKAVQEIQETNTTATAAATAAATFTSSTNEEEDFSSWCGWHNDHGSLTALCPAMYFEQNPIDGSVTILERSPDPSAGLYIRSRDGELHHVKAPSTKHLLFQIGETSQIHSGGILQATPHAVRGVNVPNVCRSTFACFMEPGWEEIMNAPSDRNPEEAQSNKSESALPKGVPSLKSRWGSTDCPFTTCDFGAFTKATLGALH